MIQISKEEDLELENIVSLIIFIVGLAAFIYFIYRYKKTEEIVEKRVHGRNAFIALVIVFGEVYMKIVEAFPDLKILAAIIAAGIMLKATELFRGKRK